MAKKITKKTAKKPLKKASGKTAKSKKTTKAKAKKAVAKPVKKAAKPAAKKAKPAKKKAASQKKAVKKASKPAKKAAAKKTAKPVVKPQNAVMPYLNFMGNCEEAFNFYKSVFGGEFSYFSRFDQMPETDGKPMPESEKSKVMHVSLPIGGGTVLYGSDTSETFGHVTVIGNNFSISINTYSKEEADRLFNGLSAGGTVTMPLMDTFWNAYFGMCIDKFGIQWMMNFDAVKK